MRRRALLEVSMPNEKLITFDIRWSNQETTETYEAIQGMDLGWLG